SSENFYSAEGSFKIPTSIRCNSTRDLFAPWIGLNGFGNNTVQQAGVAISCATGVPTYQAWYEMFPALPVYISTAAYPISAGDTIFIWVTSYRNLNGTYTITIEGNGWSFQTMQSGGPTTAISAEAVTESPLNPPSYPNFGTIQFMQLRGYIYGTHEGNVFDEGTTSMSIPKYNLSATNHYGNTVIVETTSSNISCEEPYCQFVTTYVHE
ncbi:MAG TPA: G1 family glutamic endopeptidase, partial [Dokdonella sp.]